MLTLTFALTCIICIQHFATCWRASRKDSRPIAEPHRLALVADANHFVMSIAMLVMVWTSAGQIATWAQIAFFTAAGAIMVTGLFRTPETAQKITVGFHITLNAAMVWMLAAMPILMNDQMGQNTGHGDMGGSEMAMTMAPTPIWAAPTNWTAIILCAIATCWWAVQSARSRRIDIHAFCHALMGFGMTAMLILM
ncbi:MAG: DUF5134 domain-containing protein [Brevibacterium aurantiacum]|uniref:DUF5134 domain-containing protein n=1 Tax=Brevibacterium linens TaxID=1703 RepID=A0A142NQA3_BRELN|nr:hypothetical protein A2T55_14355 [Brevibacterium linens]MDN5737288.1 DUF5134 domain-containing protein [Brevibacterium aurantiacum]